MPPTKFQHMVDRVKALGGVKIHNAKNRPAVPKGVIYCGRPGILGNPFEIGKDGNRDEVCEKHEVWLLTGKSFGCKAATEERRQLVLENLPLLRGQDLECWCWPQKCHCETLARLANRSQKDAATDSCGQGL